MHIYIYSMTITFKFEHLEHLKISFLFQTKNILLYQDVVTTYCLQAIVNNAALSLSEIKKKCFFLIRKSNCTIVSICKKFTVWINTGSYIVDIN